MEKYFDAMISLNLYLEVIITNSNHVCHKKLNAIAILSYPYQISQIKKISAVALAGKMNHANL